MNSEQKIESRKATSVKVFLALISFVFLAIASSIAGYVAMNKGGTIWPPRVSLLPSFAPTPSPLAQDETKSWKTYDNPDAVFSFRYPSNWTVQNDSGSIVTIGSGSDETLTVGAGEGSSDTSLEDNIDFLKTSMEKSQNSLIEIDAVNIEGARVFMNLSMPNASKQAFLVTSDKVVSVFYAYYKYPGTFDAEKEKFFLEKLLPTFALNNKKLCSQEDIEEKVNCFASRITKYSLSDDVAGSDDKLKEYFIGNFDGINMDQEKSIDNLTFTGISRGKFDKNSDNEMIIVSFEWNVGKFTNSYLVIIKKEAPSYYQATSQEFEFQSFEKNPDKLVKLIKDDSPLLVSKSAYTGGTCVSLLGNILIYKLVNDEFVSVWTNQYFVDGKKYEGKIDSGAIETIDTKITYKDLDNDGNFEIIKEGTKQTCEGEDACYSSECTKFFGQGKVYESYKWDAQKQTFVLIK